MTDISIEIIPAGAIGFKTTTTVVVSISKKVYDLIKNLEQISYEKLGEISIISCGASLAPIVCSWSIQFNKYGTFIYEVDPKNVPNIKLFDKLIKKIKKMCI